MATTVERPTAAAERTATPVRRRTGRPRSVVGTLETVGGHVILVTLSVFAIAPLVWSIGGAFKSDAEIIGRVNPFPLEPTLANFETVLAETQFNRWFMNSLIVAVTTTGLAIVVGGLGGYAMSRWNFYGRGLYGNALLIIQMFPGVMLGIPLYLLLSDYGLVNTLWALIVTYLTFSLSFAVWMLKGFFDGIP